MAQPLLGVDALRPLHPGAVPAEFGRIVDSATKYFNAALVIAVTQLQVCGVVIQ